MTSLAISFPRASMSGGRSKAGFAVPFAPGPGKQRVGQEGGGALIDLAAFGLRPLANPSDQVAATRWIAGNDPGIVGQELFQRRGQGGDGGIEQDQGRGFGNAPEQDLPSRLPDPCRCLSRGGQ